MQRLNRETLLQQLESVMPGLAPREIVEQSSCFVFKKKHVLTFNDEVACSHKCDLKITGAIKAEPVVGLLRKLVEDEIDIGVEDGKLLIKGKNRKASIVMEDEIVLPVDELEVPETWSALPEDFGDGVELVHHCTGKDASAFHLACVHVCPKWVEACDNYHMSRYKVDTGLSKGEDVLVRGTALKAIVPFGMTEMSRTNNWLHFRNPAGLVLSCRMYVETDEFPNLTTVLKVEGKKMSLPKGVQQACERAEVFSSDNADSEENQVFVSLRPGKLRIRGQGASGWYTEVKKLTYDGDSMDFSLAPKLLQELVNHNECEVTDDYLKVANGRFTYVTCLDRPEEDDDAGDDE